MPTAGTPIPPGCWPPNCMTASNQIKNRKINCKRKGIQRTQDDININQNRKAKDDNTVESCSTQSHIPYLCTSKERKFRTQDLTPSILYKPKKSKTIIRVFIKLKYNLP